MCACARCSRVRIICTFLRPACNLNLSAHLRPLSLLSRRSANLQTSSRSPHPPLDGHTVHTSEDPWWCVQSAIARLLSSTHKQAQAPRQIQYIPPLIWPTSDTYPAQASPRLCSGKSSGRSHIPFPVHCLCGRHSIRPTFLSIVGLFARVPLSAFSSSRA